MTQRTWFITGTSSGFGRSLAEAVIKYGDKVVATARKVSDIESLKALAPDRVLTLTLDVHNEYHAEKAVEEAISAFGSIDVLVNNAGYGLLGSFEDVTDEQIRNQFETNVFGLMNITRAVLPVLRKQKSGHIINMSSAAGVTTFPGFSVYCASKFAVEGLSLGLAQELEPLGIKMTILEPGAFRTKWASVTLEQAPTDDMNEYKETAGGIRSWLTSVNGSQPGDPDRAANIIIGLVNSPNPPLQLVLGEQAVQDVKDRLGTHLKDIEDWSDVSVSSDFEKPYPVDLPIQK
ncbi:oxidoreductase [Bacillus thuringiensis]|uniref:oxidoreductase n=1 Tax=Bacillus thuringiensis TaxID=1428 RepID=UPI000BF298C6|nr:oxidoreductase [Bacillus thuringiensis]PEV21376.1 short-chain dehydrogenase/reductase [Bacillus thuringiensis]PFU03811.1 short-chain dehydrogenase/reductase [Bacillus thuringiensis]PFU73465.1 short-chain dehydrogenase/reductase [Bacillus thuringiensis]